MNIIDQIFYLVSDFRKCIMIKCNSICLISFVYLNAQPLKSAYYITELAHNKLNHPDLKYDEKRCQSLPNSYSLSIENEIHTRGLFCLFLLVLNIIHSIYLRISLYTK